MSKNSGRAFATATSRSRVSTPQQRQSARVKNSALPTYHLLRAEFKNRLTNAELTELSDEILAIMGSEAQLVVPVLPGGVEVKAICLLPKWFIERRISLSRRGVAYLCANPVEGKYFPEECLDENAKQKLQSLGVVFGQPKPAVYSSVQALIKFRSGGLIRSKKTNIRVQEQTVSALARAAQRRYPELKIVSIKVLSFR